jgi:hypothetical protein
VREGGRLPQRSQASLSQPPWSSRPSDAGEAGFAAASGIGEEEEGFASGIGEERFATGTLGHWRLTSTAQSARRKYGNEPLVSALLVQHINLRLLCTV